MKCTSPLVSVGIPTFNRANLLVKCLNSVLQQSYENIEVIVSDNMSSDSTPDVCLEFMNQDQRVKTYRQTANIKAVPNFDYVRRKSKGEYFMLLGDDDWIDTELIQSCVQFLEDNPDHIAASGETYYYRENDVKFKGVSLSIQSDDPSERAINAIAEIIDGGTFYALYRAKPANEIPYLNAWGTDYFFLCEAAFRGKITTLPDVACHRIDNSNRRSIKEVLHGEGIVDGQELDPYGMIASVLFWRIVADGSVFKQMGYCDRYRFASDVVNTVNQRWPITGDVDLLNIADNLFTDQNLLEEYHSLLARVMSEWITASKNGTNSKWRSARQILDVFIKLGFSSSNTRSEESRLLNEIIETSDAGDDLELKNDAYRILSLFI